jgi:hypothetical protein
MRRSTNSALVFLVSIYMGTYTLLAQNNPQTVVSQTNLAKADITEVGMNMFSMAHTWEK